MGSKGWRVVAIAAVVGIAVATLVPPAAQQLAGRAGANDSVALEERCERSVTEFVDDLQAHIDSVAAMSAAELAQQATGEALADRAQSFSQRVEALGCDEEATGERLVAELEGLEGAGLVAELTAETVRAAVMGAPPSLPAELEVTASDDLAAVVALAPGGATLRLAAGEHRASEPLVVGHALSIVGAGQDETTIASTAAEVALAYTGTGRFELEGLTVAHEGDEPASVVVVQRGSSRLAAVRVTGGATEPDGGGGAGLVLGPEDHDPAAGTGTSTRDLTVEDVEVADNEGAGVIVRGREAPRITGATVTGNGACGVCFLESSGGTLADSRLAGNEVGVAVGGQADPRVTGTTIEDNRRTGIAVEADGQGTFEDNTVTGNGDFGLVVHDRGAPRLSGTTLRDHAEAGAALSGETAAVLEGNTVEGSPIGVWLDGDASPTLEANRLRGGDSAGLVFAESAAGHAVDNEVDGFPIGVEVRDEAAPDLRGTRVTDAYEAALVFRDDSAGAASGTACSGGEARIVLVDRASPSLDGNDCRLDDLR